MWGRRGLVGGRASDRPGGEGGMEGVGQPRGQDRTLSIGRGTPVPLGRAGRCDEVGMWVGVRMWTQAGLAAQGRREKSGSLRKRMKLEEIALFKFVV